MAAPAMTMIIDGDSITFRPNPAFVAQCNSLLADTYRKVAAALGLEPADNWLKAKATVIAELQRRGVVRHMPPALPEAELLLLSLAGRRLDVDLTAWPNTTEELRQLIEQEILRRS